MAKKLKVTKRLQCPACKGYFLLRRVPKNNLKICETFGCWTVIDVGKLLNGA